MESEVHYSEPTFLKCPWCHNENVSVIGVAMFKPEPASNNRQCFYTVRDDATQSVYAQLVPDRPGIPQMQGRTAFVYFRGACGHNWCATYRNENDRTAVMEQGELAEQPAPIISGLEIAGEHAATTIFMTPETDFELTPLGVEVAHVVKSAAPPGTSTQGQPEEVLKFAGAVWKHALASVQKERPQLAQFIDVAIPLGFNGGQYWLNYEEKHATVAQAMALPANRAFIERTLARIMQLPRTTVAIMVDGNPI